MRILILTNLVETEALVKRATFDLSPQKRLCWAAPLLCWVLCDCDDTATEAAAMEPPITTAPVVAISSTTSSPLNRPRSSGTKAKRSTQRRPKYELQPVYAWENWKLRVQFEEVGGPALRRGARRMEWGVWESVGERRTGPPKGDSEGDKERGNESTALLFHTPRCHRAAPTTSPATSDFRGSHGSLLLSDCHLDWRLWPTTDGAPGVVLLAGIDGLFTRKELLFFSPWLLIVQFFSE